MRIFRKGHPLLRPLGTLLPFNLLGDAGLDWGNLLPVISFDKLVYRSCG